MVIAGLSAMPMGPDRPVLCRFVDGRRVARTRRAVSFSTPRGGRLMKKLAAVLFVAILVVGQGPVRGEEKNTNDLKALDARLTQAFKNHDIQELEKHSASDMLVIDPLGRVHNAKQYFAHLEKGGAKISELTESDVKARMFGNTGIVTGLLHLKAMVGDKDISGEYRWTRVYVKQGDEWKVVTEQHTYVLPPQK
jgi:ketosteroid isomerase-like protein